MKQQIVDYIFTLFIVFFTPKKTTNELHTVGISTLLCHRDVNRYIYSIFSLYAQLHRVLPLYVVDDGSLTQKDIMKLHTYFSVQIESPVLANKKMSTLTKKYPFLHRLRFDPHAGVFKKKLDAYILCPFSRFIYLDSDILFFQEPKEIIKWIDKNIDKVYYTLRREDSSNIRTREAVITQLSFRMLLYTHAASSTHPLFIAGLLCIPHRDAIDLSILNNSIKTLYTFAYGHAALAEEAAVAMSLRPKYSKYLSITKYVNINCFVEYVWSHSLKSVISIHYSGDSKLYFFERDALALAIRSKFFTN